MDWGGGAGFIVEQLPSCGALGQGEARLGGAGTGRGKGAACREERCPQSPWGGAGPGPGSSTWPGQGWAWPGAWMLARCLDAGSSG